MTTDFLSQAGVCFGWTEPSVAGVNGIKIHCFLSKASNRKMSSTEGVLQVIDILQASAVTGYTRGSYSIRSRGVAEASN